MSVEGPSKVDINCEDMEDGTCRVSYCPTEPGSYTVNIKFAEKHIPGLDLLLRKCRITKKRHLKNKKCVFLFFTLHVFVPFRKSFHSEGDRRRKDQGEYYQKETGVFYCLSG